MKKTIAIIITAVFAFFGTANAQQKIGHINSLDILQAMPEFKQMNTDIDKQKQSYQKDLQALSNDKSTPDPIIESKIQELQDLQKRIQDFESKVNDDLQKLQQEKSKPI